MPARGLQQTQRAHVGERIEQEEAGRRVGGVPRDCRPQSVLPDEELAAVTVVQVVGRGLRVPLRGPQPAGRAEGLPGLVPRRIGVLQSPVDQREGIPGLVLTEPSDARARPRQVRGTKEIPRGEIEGLDAAVVRQKTADTPAALPILRGRVSGLV